MKKLSFKFYKFSQIFKNCNRCKEDNSEESYLFVPGEIILTQCWRYCFKESLRER